MELHSFLKIYPSCITLLHTALKKRVNISYRNAERKIVITFILEFHSKIAYYIPDSFRIFISHMKNYVLCLK